MSTRARGAAAFVLERVLDRGAFSQHALASILGRGQLSPRDRGWVTATVYGVLSDVRAVDLALERLLPKGLDSLEPKVRAHLRVGVWEIARSGREGAPAALVSAAVNGIKGDGLPRRSGLVNGVLRSLLRDQDNLLKPPKKGSEATKFGLDNGLPDWIAERLLERRTDAAAAMDGFNRPTRVQLRARVDRDALTATLSKEGLKTVPHPYAPHGLIVQGGNAAATRAFADREFAIQDGGAQLAIHTLPPSLSDAPRVLDACAGVGGKTLELLDTYPTAQVVATDIYAKKLDKIDADSDRLTTVPWDIVEEPAPDALTAAPFDVVVLDAPCSALGTMGRHPEVRWNRSADVVDSLAEMQRAMLDKVAPLVAPGGWLLYVVCTWTAEETEQTVAQFLEKHPDFTVTPPTRETASPDVAWDALVDARGTFSLWPHLHDTDAFFVARFQRGDGT